jgi:hypothetical protein
VVYPWSASRPLTRKIAQSTHWDGLEKEKRFRDGRALLVTTCMEVKRGHDETMRTVQNLQVKLNKLEK